MQNLIALKILINAKRMTIMADFVFSGMTSKNGGAFSAMEELTAVPYSFRSVSFSNYLLIRVHSTTAANCLNQLQSFNVTLSKM